MPGWCVFLVVNPPLTTSATLERTCSSDATELLARLFDAHRERLFRLARRLCSDRDEALDLVQETFLRVAARPGAVPAGAASEEAWLVRTLVNLVRDRYRRLSVRSRVHADLRRGGDGASHPEEAAVARATVQAALARLAPRRRAAVVLHELEGVPVRDVARLLGVTEVTVRWHLLAARRELAKLLLPPAGNVPEERRRR